MTKQEEINLFKNFMAQLPRDAEYLRSILGAIEGEVCQAIRDDFGFISFTERMDEQRRYQKEMAEARSQRNGMENEVRQLERQRDRLRADIDEAKKLALRVYQAS